VACSQAAYLAAVEAQMDLRFDTLASSLRDATTRRRSGRIVNLVGTVMEADLPGARIGEVCRIEDGPLAETIGFRESRAILMPFGPLEGIRFGSLVETTGELAAVRIGEALQGRVIDGFGEPADGKGPFHSSGRWPLQVPPPDPLSRAPIRKPFVTGVRLLDGLLTFGKGQRVGLMAGSGVGKSTLMGMIARNSLADINVIALIGERGREVREFLEDVLGPEGMARSVVVVVTSDKPPVLQVRGAFVAATIADWFRAQGKDVLFFMDSVTRLAMAQRQIGLAAGEPPTTKGYTPSVFSLLPRLLERAGASEHGTITGIYTVLIDGDDLQDPIGDAVRGIVDGHIVLTRKLAVHGQYPAVDVLQSISRVMRSVITPQHRELAQKLRGLMAVWAENEELIRLGAYKAGASAQVDTAIARIDGIRAFLMQDTKERTTLEQAVAGIVAAIK
jgi:flagellum-specific ATP synthase